MFTPHPRPVTLFDHAFALMLAVAFPLFAKFYAFPKLLHEVDRGDPNARTSAYLMTIVIQWALVVVLALAWRRLARPGSTLGLDVPRGWRLALALALPLVAAALMVMQYHGIATSAEAMEHARVEMKEVSGLLPHTPFELRLFIALSTTAGICEELLYRGFLVGYAARFMPPPVAVFVTGVVFGFGHIYQGLGNAIQTGIVGIVAGSLYLLIGSIWPLMALHAIVDIGGGFVGWLVARS